MINDGRIIADMNAHELVCSDVLIKNGIREPLYVTAMKYAGIKVDARDETRAHLEPGHRKGSTQRSARAGTALCTP